MASPRKYPGVCSHKELTGKRLATVAALVASGAVQAHPKPTSSMSARLHRCQLSHAWAVWPDASHGKGQRRGGVRPCRKNRIGRGGHATFPNTGHALLDKTIQTADFFDATRSPVISFKATRMTLDGEQPSTTGELTIKRSDYNMGKLALLVSDGITRNPAIKAVRQTDYVQVASRDPVR